MILAAGGCERLGVIVNADANLNSRWDSLKTVLTKAKYPTLRKKKHDRNGTIIPSTDVLPQVGVWLMPNNRDAGMLEDYLKSWIPKEDPLLIQAEKCVDEVPETESRFKDVHRARR